MRRAARAIRESRSARPARADRHAAGRVVGGVLTARQSYDANVEALAQRELHPSERRVFARRVGVEAEEDALRQARELAELTLGERGSHRGDDRLEAGLAQRDHIGVALDDDGAVLLRDRTTR